MRKFASAFVVLLFFSATACKGASSNLLIGTWVLDRSGAAPSPYCQAQLTFAEKTFTAPDVNGKVNTIRDREQQHLSYRGLCADRRWNYLSHDI